MSECVFCQIVKQELPAYRVWEDENFVAFLDHRPVNPGHTLLVPKQHGEYLFDIEVEMYRALFDKVRILEPILRCATGAPKLGLALEGYGVPHAHLHLIPIFGPFEVDPNRARLAGVDELQAMLEKIKSAMSAG